MTKEGGRERGKESRKLPISCCHIPGASEPGQKWWVGEREGVGRLPAGRTALTLVLSDPPISPGSQKSCSGASPGQRVSWPLHTGRSCLDLSFLWLLMRELSPKQR